jgi:PQ loop repeat
MLTITQIGGFVGAGLAGAGYLPQISHLVRARCAAGLSRLAFGVWLLASVLVTARAVAIGADVFIALGAIQIVATALIVACAAWYQGNDPGSRRAGKPVAASAAPAGPGGTRRGSVPVLRRHGHAVTETAHLEGTT